MKSSVAAVLLLLSLGGAAFAADSLQLRSEVFHEVDVAGAGGKSEKKLEPAKNVAPGSNVVYVISYKNVGAQPADHVIISNPIPPELEFVSQSADSAGPAGEVSVDGGKSWGALTALHVAGANGASRPALPTDVTHVRWVLAAAVKPGAEGKVTYRARLK